MLMYGVHHLRPEIPSAPVAFVDAPVEPLDRNKDGAKSILLNQRTRRTLNSREHSLALLRP
jgi:hypothetical protein